MKVKKPIKVGHKILHDMGMEEIWGKKSQYFHDVQRLNLPVVLVCPSEDPNETPLLTEWRQRFEELLVNQHQADIVYLNTTCCHKYRLVVAKIPLRGLGGIAEELGVKMPIDKLTYKTGWLDSEVSDTNENTAIYKIIQNTARR